MPIHVPRQVKCPRCAEAFEAPLVGAQHARKGAVREHVLSDRLGRVDCPGCGGSVRTEPTLLYTDFPRRQYYALLPEHGFRHRDDLAAQVHEGFRVGFEVAAAPIVRSWAPEFRVRVVFGPDRLREKLVADDLGLDDRLVEIGKVGLLRDVAPSRFDWRTPLVLRRADGEKLIFAVTDAADRAVIDVHSPHRAGTEIVRELQVDRSWYDGLVARRAELEATFPEWFAGVVVDFRALLAPPSVPLPKDDPPVAPRFEVLP